MMNINGTEGGIGSDTFTTATFATVFDNDDNDDDGYGYNEYLWNY